MKKIISTPDAPAAIGPYSQAVRVGSTVYCAGQIPLDPKSGQIVSDDIAEQTRRVMENISAVLRAENLDFSNVVKTTIFLTSLGDFQTVNEIYATYFRENPPARSTVQVSALPKGAKVEIEAIAMA
jgi:2-iminobutanoate/2-iminopropanoate deaminase